MNEPIENVQDPAEEDLEEVSGETFYDNRLPRRYRVYDRIKEHVSLRSIDLVIAVTAILIVVFLVIGIMTGNR